MSASVVLWIVLTTTGGWLLQGSQEVIWPCSSDENCELVSNATCSSSKFCRCPAGFVFSQDLTKCLEGKFVGEDCKESTQCAHMPSGAKCNSGICACNDGQTYIRGRCRILQGLGDRCSEDIDCWFGYDRESVKCKNHKCSCADEFYERYENICRRKSMECDSDCVVDADCAFIKENGVKCENRKCNCIKDARKVSKDIGVQTSFDFFQLKPVSEQDEEESDKDDEDIPLKQFSSDSNGNLKFGDKCSENGKECKELPHSICVDNLCLCKLGYYPKDRKCMAELGEEAARSDLCAGKNAEYDDKHKKCLCKRNFFYDDSLRSCRKPIINREASCTHSNQCSPFGLAFCNKEVSPKKCVCEIYARYDANRQLCVHKQGVGSFCESEKTCAQIPHTYCSKEKICLCTEHFTERNGQCAPMIGGSCTKHTDCAAKNSECVSQNSNKEDATGFVCRCQKGYVKFQGDCLKEASKLDEECTESEQCKPLLGELGKCINNKCSCEEHHQLSFGKCEEKKAIGEKCSKSSECFTPEDPQLLECRNSICRCQIGHNVDVEKQICIKPKKNSSGRPSVLKIITFMLIGSAVLVTSAALKQAYY